MTAAGGVDLPGDVAGAVALGELVIHGWDLAKATGQSAAYDGPELDVVHETVRRFTADGFEGLFGPPVSVPDDAPLLDRVVGLAGQRPELGPAWLTRRGVRKCARFGLQRGARPKPSDPFADERKGRLALGGAVARPPASRW